MAPKPKANANPVVEKKPVPVNVRVLAEELKLRSASTNDLYDMVAAAILQMRYFKGEIHSSCQLFFIRQMKDLFGMTYQFPEPKQKGKRK